MLIYCWWCQHVSQMWVLLPQLSKEAMSAETHILFTYLRLREAGKQRLCCPWGFCTVDKLGGDTSDSDVREGIMKANYIILTHTDCNESLNLFFYSRYITFLSQYPLYPCLSRITWHFDKKVSFNYSHVHMLDRLKESYTTEMNFSLNGGI